MKLRLLLLCCLMVVGAQGHRAEVKFPEETQNAALRYWMAFAEMQDPFADQTIKDLLEKTAAGQAAWDELKLGPILDSNGEALRIMQRAAKLLDCDWGLEYGIGPKVPIAYLTRARVMARLNILQAMRETAAKNSQAALECCLAGVRFSAHLAKGGSLISGLTAKSALLPHLRMLTLEARNGRLTGAQTRQILATLEMLPEDGFNWSNAWEIEQLLVEVFLAELRSSKNPKATFEASMGEAMPEGMAVPSPNDLRTFREYMAGVKDALKLSPDAAKARLDRLETQKRTLNELTRRLIPASKKVNEARGEIFVARKALLDALATR